MTQSYPKKNIVRLRRGSRAYIKLQLAVLRRDGFRCQECSTYTEAPPHHVIKLSQGGSDILENMVTLCVDCHARYPNWTTKTLKGD